MPLAEDLAQHLPSRFDTSLEPARVLAPSTLRETQRVRWLADDSGLIVLTNAGDSDVDDAGHAERIVIPGCSVDRLD